MEYHVPTRLLYYQYLAPVWRVVGDLELSFLPDTESSFNEHVRAGLRTNALCELGAIDINGL